MNEPKAAVVLITAGSDGEAARISRLLVEKRKAACVNTIPHVSSLYWWQGKIESAPESLLIVKTRADLVPEVVELVRQAHTYKVPEVVALPIIGGNQDYLKWLAEETRPQAGPPQPNPKL